MMSQSITDVEIIASVQNTYNLYVTDEGILTCDSIVKIPLSYSVKVKTNINGRTNIILPVVEFNVPIDDVVFEIVTNEGTLVEPFRSAAFNTLTPFFTGEHTYFVLPKGSTGIKQVLTKSTRQGLKSAIVFDIMPPPYNYYVSGLDIISDVVIYQGKLVAKNNENVSALTSRVDALESKRLYVKQVPLKSYPGFFKIFGTNDQNGILGWIITFTTTGDLLTLTSGSSASSKGNVIINGAGITGHKKLALTYDKGASIFNLYSITEGVTGTISSQIYLASGLGRITSAPQDLHLLIDGVELNVLDKGSGFVSYI